jgi:hypothetical protein
MVNAVLHCNKRINDTICVKQRTAFLGGVGNYVSRLKQGSNLTGNGWDQSRLQYRPTRGNPNNTKIRLSQSNWADGLLTNKMRSEKGIVTDMRD